MLKNITRDDVPPPHKPHKNTLKGIKHSHIMGTIDFQGERKTSTNSYFYNKKPPVASRVEFEHPSTSHFDLTHNHFNNKLPISMTKNDFSTYSYNPSNLFGESKKVRKRAASKAFKNQNLTKIVSNGIMKQSNSLAYRDPKKPLPAYRTKPTKSRVGLLKSNFEFGDSKKKIESKSAYSKFCDSLGKKTRFPELRCGSNARKFDIISNVERSDKGSKHFGFDHFDKTQKSNLRTGYKNPIPPSKQRFFLY